MLFKRILFAVLFSFCLKAWAGAWLQSPGQGLDILSFGYYQSDEYWNSDAELSNSPTYSKYELADYLEYGATPKLTLGFYFSGLQSQTAASGTLTGLYDNQLFARYQLWQQPNQVLSVQAFVDKLGNAARFNLPAQNGEYNTGEALQFGTSGVISQSNRPWFFDSALGLVQRYGAGDQAKLNLSLGEKFDQNKFWLLFQDYNTASLDCVTHPMDSNYNLVTLSPSVVYWFNEVALQLGVTQDVYGYNVGRGSMVFLASWFKF